MYLFIPPAKTHSYRERERDRDRDRKRRGRWGEKMEKVGRGVKDREGK